MKIISCRRIHLGKNPKKGGNPPKESKFKNNNGAQNPKIGLEIIWLICCKLNSEKTEIIALNKIIYVKK